LAPIEHGKIIVFIKLREYTYIFSGVAHTTKTDPSHQVIILSEKNDLVSFEVTQDNQIVIEAFENKLKD
jgi:hypothetical protein